MSIPYLWDDYQAEYILKLMDNLGLITLFETGTYFGQTSLYFHDKGFNVYTVEIDDDKYKSAIPLLMKKRIHTYHSDSIPVLKAYLDSFGTDDTLFFLDAHGHGHGRGGEHGPLAEELNLLFTQPKFIAVVHDVVWHPKMFPGGSSHLIQEDFNNATIPQGINMIYTNYPISNKCASYVIMSRGYDLVKDDKFLYEVT